MRLMRLVPYSGTQSMSHMCKEETRQMQLPSISHPAPACCSSQCQVWNTGIISSFLSFIMMIISMVLLVTDTSWYLVMQKAHLWLEENKWDIKVSRT